MPGFNIALQPQPGGPADPPSFGPPNTYETARKYRFNLTSFRPNEFVASGINFNVKSIKRPSVQFEEIVIHSGQDEIYRPGKTKWQPVDIVFYETLGSNFVDRVALSMYDWWARRLTDATVSTQRLAGLMTPNPATGFYFNSQIDMLDGYGFMVWSYILYECWPTQITPSDLDYSSTDIAEMTVTLRYNRAAETS